MRTKIKNFFLCIVLLLLSFTLRAQTFPLASWADKSYGENVLEKDFPTSLCTKNMGARFSMNYNIKSVAPAYKETFNKAMFYMNWIIYNTDFLNMVRLQPFVKISGEEVAARIKYSALNLSFSFRSFGALGKSYVCSASQKIILNKSRLYVGPWGLARTVFHESMHVIGLGHNHGFVPVIGPLMQKYYDQYQAQMDAEYKILTGT